MDVQQHTMGPFITPDGLFRVDFEMFEMRMSHWVCNPRVTHIPSGHVLLNCFGSMDDGAPSVDDEGRLHLAMRTYPGSSPGWELIYDARDGTITHVDGSRAETSIHPTLIKYASRPVAPSSSEPAPQPRPSRTPPESRRTITPPMSRPAPAATAPHDPPSTIRTLPRWVGVIYPLLFIGAIPAIMLGAWLLSRSSLFASLPRTLALGVAQFIIGVVLLGGMFGFLVWMYRGRRS